MRVRQSDGRHELADASLIRQAVIKPKAIREMVEFLNEDIRMRPERRGPDPLRARARVQTLERQDANLRRALRSAGLKATQRGSPSRSKPLVPSWPRRPLGFGTSSGRSGVSGSPRSSSRKRWIR